MSATDAKPCSVLNMTALEAVSASNRQPVHFPQNVYDVLSPTCLAAAFCTESVALTAVVDTICRYSTDLQ